MSIQSQNIQTYSISNLTDNKIKELIDQKKSFIVKDIDHTKLGGVVSLVEKAIESKGLKCRVYTENRASTMAAVAIPTPVTIWAGVAAGIAIGAHNLATWNPDYEVGRNITAGTIKVNYKK
ncbi:hypothetical protein RFH39_16910 [Acinetobacter baumannii]|uniref:hypothetical protein n=1 Tax=Acinetobacter baumannii TaxID=470 RepID=UPI00280E96FE|nr:hypothetical protein [Acinetobacter baumannii]MDQ8919972.1 hypothetical protein [Acinetobacter baumannii]MDQ8950924.1 hypothetical protein [Acinetobacter baumannii]MDQ8965043.1 hypothetical protein [Acinetobacter baumannii]MDQ8968810.1 hypothetical protein [Acinetobacter baumannii]MDQ8982785.1 hypothetical protein [Acinetobacter baumannii]